MTLLLESVRIYSIDVIEINDNFVVILLKYLKDIDKYSILKMKLRNKY